MTVLNRRNLLLTALGIGGVMAFRADDLTSVLMAAPEGPSQPMSYRQGVIVTFNRATLENTVQVGGSVLTNVPILGISDAASLGPGNVVGLMVVGSTWAILGRMVTPGTQEATDAITAVSQKIYTGYEPGLQTVTSVPFADLPGGPALDFVVGASGRVLIMIGADSQGVNDGPIMSFALSGANTLAASSDRAYFVRGVSTVPSTDAILVRVQAAAVIGLDSLTPGLTTITAKYAEASGGPGNSAGVSRRRITVFAL